MFNGVEGDGHETFVINRVDDDHMPHHEIMVFDFCKTAHKPYDLCVTACLIVLKHHFKDDILVHSDGDDPDWEQARKLCDEILGYGDDFRLDKEE